MCICTCTICCYHWKQLPVPPRSSSVPLQVHEIHLSKNVQFNIDTIRNKNINDKDTKQTQFKQMETNTNNEINNVKDSDIITIEIDKSDEKHNCKPTIITSSKQQNAISNNDKIIKIYNQSKTISPNNAPKNHKTDNDNLSGNRFKSQQSNNRKRKRRKWGNATLGLKTNKRRRLSNSNWDMLGCNYRDWEEQIMEETFVDEYASYLEYALCFFSIFFFFCFWGYIFFIS